MRAATRELAFDDVGAFTDRPDLFLSTLQPFNAITGLRRHVDVCVSLVYTRALELQCRPTTATGLREP